MRARSGHAARRRAAREAAGRDRGVGAGGRDDDGAGRGLQLDEASEHPQPAGAIGGDVHGVLAAEVDDLGGRGGDGKHARRCDHEGVQVAALEVQLVMVSIGAVEADPGLRAEPRVADPGDLEPGLVRAGVECGAHGQHAGRHRGATTRDVAAVRLEREPGRAGARDGTGLRTRAPRDREHDHGDDGRGGERGADRDPSARAGPGEAWSAERRVEAERCVEAERREQLLELDWLGGAAERRLRQSRPGFDDLPWGSFDLSRLDPEDPELVASRAYMERVVEERIVARLARHGIACSTGPAATG